MIDNKTGLFKPISKPDWFPEIKRARGFRVYDYKGNRYLDLYLNGGRALLGHRVTKVQQILKSTLSKGLIAEYPTHVNKQLEKSLSHLARIIQDNNPDNLTILQSGVYSNMERALQAAAEAYGVSFTEVRLKDPLWPKLGDPRFCLWRPLLGPPYKTKQETQNKMKEQINKKEQEIQKGVLLFPFLPFPAMFGPVIIFAGIKGNKALMAQKPPISSSIIPKLPPSDLISPLLAGVLVKVIGEVISYEPLTVLWEKIWDSYSGPWQRKGPYVVVNMDRHEYKHLVSLGLDKKVILPPVPEQPIILPGDFHPGEIRPFLLEVEKRYGG